MKAPLPQLASARFYRPIAGAIILAASFLPTTSRAHLMVAQRGTLNFVGDGVFMVLSLPVTAFEHIDDDGDDRLSAAEFSNHRLAIAKAVNNHVQLLDKQGPRPLEGMMLSPVTPHDNPAAPSEQLVVMGKFELANIDASTSFQINLFGKHPHEQQFTVTATRKPNSQKHKIELTPTHYHRQLFPADRAVSTAANH